MPLSLMIENETSLPDGGPLSVSVSGKRGLDIGRDRHLDWTLPDPSRTISGKHCEIRYKDGAYWLHDVSTNGTFVNGSDRRVQGTHRLRNGDRLTIGHYIVAVALEGEEASSVPERVVEQSSYQELWSDGGGSAPPLDPAQLRAPAERARPVKADFLDWASDVPVDFGGGLLQSHAGDHAGGNPFAAPPPSAPPASFRPGNDPFSDPGFSPPPVAANAGFAAPQRPEVAPPPTLARPHVAARAPAEDQSWADGAPKAAPPVEPPPATPNPRRPVWVSTEPGGPWGGAGDPSKADAPPPGGAATSPAGSPGADPFAADPAVPQAFAPLPPLAGGEAAAQPFNSPAAAPSAAAAPLDPAAAASFVAAFARGARMSEQDFQLQADPARLAEQAGELMRLMVDNLRQLLTARQQVKRLARTSQTTIQALDNNPLKFSPSSEDAMRLMFGPPTRSYLSPRRTVEQSFEDLKAHQLKTYTAMQQALGMLIEDLDPRAIDNDTSADKGIAAMVGSRKAKLWDAFVARWQAKASRNDQGMVDVFMQYFAECYERSGKDRG